MAELWIPNLQQYPDINNPFDMMVVLQEQLNGIDGLKPAQNDAFFAVRAIANAIRYFDDEKKAALDVKTRAAIIPSVEGGPDALVRDVGLIGSLGSIEATPMQIGDSPRYHLTFGVDIETMYPAGNPEDSDLVLRPGKVPIATVDMIEFAA